MIKMKLRHLPNILTTIRIILVSFLIFLPPLTVASMVVFVLAGTTDMIDGPLARRIKNASSEFGAELDSMADMYMVIVSIFFIMPAFDLWRPLWFGILAALGFKLMSAIPGIAKHRKVFFLHTLSNKFLGFVLFLAALMYFIFGGITAVNIYFVFLIVAVFIITLEEMIIISLLDYPNKNIKGFWQIKSINEDYRRSKA